MKKIVLQHDFVLERGGVIQNLEIVYHTYGTLNEQKSNVVWVCHALTANSDVFDWWPGLFGNNNLFNEKEHFIVCANILGSCYGSTGPQTPQDNQRPLLNRFPEVTIRDMVRCHSILKNYLGIDKIQLGIGASLGGQQLVEWNIYEPELFERNVLIATNAKHSAWGIAFNQSQRLAIETDPTFKLGLLDGGKQGLITARSIAMLSYRSYEGYNKQQTNRESSRLSNFLAASYQNYQGAKLAKRFSAYSYYILTKAMDSHNVSRGFYSVEEALGQIQAKTLILGIKSDVLFPVCEQEFLANHIAKSSFVAIESDYGHDGFLIETDKISKLISEFIQNGLKSFQKTNFKLNYN